MNRSSSSQKLKSITSIITHQRPSCTKDLNLHSNIKRLLKSNGESSLSDQKQLIRFLVCKLGMLQQKQKQNENIFLECLRSLRNQIASKEKINQSLREQILLLRQELSLLKEDLNKLLKQTDDKKSRPPKVQNSSSLVNAQSPDKQNINPYLMETLSTNKQSKKLSMALSKFQDYKLDKDTISKPNFEIQDFTTPNKITKFDEYYHNPISRQFAQNVEGQNLKKKRFLFRNQGSGEKTKSKSIGGILRRKIFVK